MLYNKQLSKNKSFELQTEGPSFMKDDIFEFKISFPRKCDHAGFYFYFGVYRLFWLNISIYDHRHWDDETNDYERVAQD